MNKTKAQKMIAKLLANATDLMFGSASVTVKIHNGRVVSVEHTVTESMREMEEQKENDVKQ